MSTEQHVIAWQVAALCVRVCATRMVIATLLLTHCNNLQMYIQGCCDNKCCTELLFQVSRMRFAIGIIVNIVKFHRVT